MSRVKMIQEDQAQGEIKEIFDQLKKKIGRVPNIFGAMGNSSAVLKAYLGISDALNHTSLSLKLREQIALAVGQINGCRYCLAAHSAVGKKAGLSDDELVEARRGVSSDPKSNSILTFVRQAVENRGWVSDQQVEALKQAGVSDQELVEIILAISVNMFTNYFNHITDPIIDFPTVEDLH